MDALAALAQGFAVAVQPVHLLFAFIGAVLGTAVGVLPGIGPALTVALLLPVTYNLAPTASFIMFTGVYYGAMYGGSTTAILIKTPGESASIVTSLEGNLMARRGRAAAALATAAIGSFVAGSLATIGLTFLAPAMVNVALAFGPPEYFGLMLLALTTVSAVLGESRLRGLISLFFGLGLGLVGIDAQTGQARFTLGLAPLLDGIGVVIVVVGLFAVGETLYAAAREPESEVMAIRGSMWMTRDEWRRSWKPWLRGTLFGFPIGALPAGGAEIPTLLSYLTEKRLTRYPEEFGKGAIEGVAGPEAANNAAAAGVLVPLLTLGLPTSATAAILLAAFQGYGLQPGPLLFEQRADLVWGVIASLYIGNVMLLVLNLPLAPLWARLLMIPRAYLYAGILVFAFLGAYAANASVADLIIMLVIGLVGYVMRLYDFPMAPVLVGMILGPLSEQQLRRSLALSQGNPLVFLTRPISAVLVAITVAVLATP
ncbi:MAG: tripartite tricarboxylate transporter permease, partial [Candidatus Rokuibacteriota bacterium]